MMISLTVNIVGLLLIGFIILWFLVLKAKAVQAKDRVIMIKVQDGIYDPSVIEAHQGDTLRLRFNRLDASPCSEYVIFDALNISAKLPKGQFHDITLTLKNAGEYEFTCQMGMYRGLLRVS